MKEKPYKLGIMGGTFNPIHQGHLVAAEIIRDEFGLDEVLFVPSGKPPHKDNNEIAAPKHRWIMTVLATASNEYFSVSAIEIERKGESYTRDTLLELKKIYGEKTQFYFITGADAIAEISTWHKSENLPKLAKFIAASRPGYKLEWEKIDPRFRNFTYLIEIPALAISSTEIRKRVRENKTIKYLLPQAVEKYIYKNKLYQKGVGS
ncbi:nicotinate-nucleotide adenylyltransferase [Candidatus Aerophobetes bacterium]|nr:nicotinate-nucleotide adenylyltransferase [Candidatus Aerophobetes bacterium]